MPFMLKFTPYCKFSLIESSLHSPLPFLSWWDFMYMLNSRKGSRWCPQDNNAISDGMIFPDSGFKREILQLQVHCPNSPNGCNHTSSISSMLQHEEDCMYAMVQCPNACQFSIMKKALKSHLQVECRQRNIICSSCKEQIHFDGQQVSCSLYINFIGVLPYV